MRGWGKLDAVLNSIYAFPVFKTLKSDYDSYKPIRAKDIIKILRSSKYIQKLINDHIVSSPSIRFGRPTIKGTRIAVEDIVQLCREGLSIKEIMDEYPSIESEEQIIAALSFHILETYRKNIFIKLAFQFVRVK